MIIVFILILFVISCTALVGLIYLGSAVVAQQRHLDEMADLFRILKTRIDKVDPAKVEHLNQELQEYKKQFIEHIEAHTKGNESRRHWR